MNYRKNDHWLSCGFLQRLAAAEIANALHLRDFRKPAIVEFFNTIARNRSFATSVGRARGAHFGEERSTRAAL
jgi:hypothetical protein